MNLGKWHILHFKISFSVKYIMKTSCSTQNLFKCKKSSIYKENKEFLLFKRFKEMTYSHTFVDLKLSILTPLRGLILPRAKSKASSCFHFKSLYYKSCSVKELYVGYSSMVPLQ